MTRKPPQRPISSPFQPGAIVTHKNGEQGVVVRLYPAGLSVGERVAVLVEASPRVDTVWPVSELRA